MTNTSTTLNSFNLPELKELEVLRGHQNILICGLLGEETARILYECLRQTDRTEQLDIVLSTGGGLVKAARRIAFLLHDYADKINILVAHKAKSAGTLLCLSAHQLIMTSMAELGPIDPYINSTHELPSGAPPLISAEEIRIYRQMAEDWFGIKREEDRIQVLALLSQRFFPTLLSSFFRSDRLIRQVASELLTFQSSQLDRDTQEHIINSLVSGYYTHDYPLLRQDLQHLGLNVVCASTQEEILLWGIEEKWRLLTDHQLNENEFLSALVFSREFKAGLVNSWTNSSSSEVNTHNQISRYLISNWQIVKGEQNGS